MRRNRKPRNLPLDNLQAYSVEQFCAAHSISRSMFFKLRNAGGGPTIFRVGSRTLISREAAARWRAAREAATDQQAS